MVAKYSSEPEMEQVRKSQFESHCFPFDYEFENKVEVLSESPGINAPYNKELHSNFTHDNLLEKYFLLWRKYCRNNRAPTTNDNRIDKFVDSLKRHKETVSVKKQQPEIHKNKRRKPRDNLNTFEHRFEAQRRVIETQRTKLTQQDRIIESLKLGLIEDELEKSLSNSKSEIKEVFRKCSVKVRCRSTVSNENVTTMHVKSRSVPRIFRCMEKRAEERSLKRQIIAQRKTMLEEIKRKHAEKVVERKKAADEEQRLKNLQAVKDARLREIELEKLKKTERETYLRGLRRAMLHRDNKLKQLGFSLFCNILHTKRRNEELGNAFYNSVVQRKCIRKWHQYVGSEMRRKYLQADSVYRLKCLKPAILSLKLVSATNGSLRLRGEISDRILDVAEEKTKSPGGARFLRNATEQRDVCHLVQICSSHTRGKRADDLFGRAALPEV